MRIKIQKTDRGKNKPKKNNGLISRKLIKARVMAQP
ncbi:Uncharacterised protein [Vibrio cholerae]|nr:Uncharacterised protein [Vibrio cholerae]